MHSWELMMNIVKKKKHRLLKTSNYASDIETRIINMELQIEKIETYELAFEILEHCKRQETL